MRKKRPTIVRIARAKMSTSLIKQTKYDVAEGFPKGCLKACSGSSGFSQYSSSHKQGISMSKLDCASGSSSISTYNQKVTHSSVLIHLGRPKKVLVKMSII